MLKVTSLNLSPDGTAAHVNFGPRDLGDLSPATLAGWLDKLRAIDPSDGQEHDPHLAIQVPAGKFILRAVGGRLYLYNARDNTQAAVEVTIPGVLEIFQEASTIHVAPAAVTTAEPPAAPAAPARRHASPLVAVALLLAGLGLAVWAVSDFFAGREAPASSAWTPVTDANMVAQHWARLGGTYATGGEPGDRVIVIGLDRRITFRQLGADTTPVEESTDTGTIGLAGQAVGVVTTNTGVIAVQPDGALLFFGDSYRRL